MWLCEDCRDIIHASRGYKPAHDDLASRKTSIESLMHSNVEQLEMVKDILRDQHSALTQQLKDQE